MVFPLMAVLGPINYGDIVCFETIHTWNTTFITHRKCVWYIEVCTWSDIVSNKINYCSLLEYNKTYLWWIAIHIIKFKTNVNICIYFTCTLCLVFWIISDLYCVVYWYLDQAMYIHNDVLDHPYKCH